jgi:hypothetical protein
MFFLFNLFEKIIFELDFYNKKKRPNKRKKDLINRVLLDLYLFILLFDKKKPPEKQTTINYLFVADGADDDSFVVAGDGSFVPPLLLAISINSCRILCDKRFGCVSFICFISFKACSSCSAAVVVGTGPTLSGR